MSDAVERFRQQQYKVLVGLGHPQRIEGLMRIASVFARRQKGRIVAVSVVVVPPHADLALGAQYADAELLRAAEEMVAVAQSFGAELGIAVDTIVEFAHDIPTGIATVCERVGADLILLGFSPPAQPAEDAQQADVPARITERVAAMAGPSLAIMAIAENEGPARLLIPATEALNPAVIRDLAKVVTLFGGAEMTFIGLLPRGLSAEQFRRRSEALRAKVEQVEFEELKCLDLDTREASHCLFGAEARQMAGESHQAAFIVRAVV
ncbi:MAG: universal stress protein [Armatimonadota bacterium]